MVDIERNADDLLIEELMSKLPEGMQGIQKELIQDMIDKEVEDRAKDLEQKIEDQNKTIDELNQTIKGLSIQIETGQLKPQSSSRYGTKNEPLFARAKTSMGTPSTSTLKSTRNSVASTPVKKFGFSG